MFPEHAIAVGRALYPVTYGVTTSFDDAVRRTVDYASANRSRKPAFSSWITRTLADPCGPAHVLWSARWAGCGFPQVTLGHRLAASLAATRMPIESIDAVRPPWPAYLVLIPSNLVRVPDKLGSAGSRMSVDFLTVFHAGPFVHVSALSRESEHTISVGHRTLAGGLEHEGDSHDDDTFARAPVPHDRCLGDTERRALALLWRMMLGVDIEMSELDPSRVRSPKRMSTSAKTERDTSSSPLMTYQLTRDVVVDCRDAVRDFVYGERRASPSVQVLVRGHWKRQAHGAGWVARRWIHVEPYWRGPEAAPVAVRRHAFRGTE